MELICEMISRGQFIVENGVHPKDSILIVLNGEFYCSFGKEEFFAKENFFQCRMPEILHTTERKI